MYVVAPIVLRFFQVLMPVKAVQIWEVIGGAISGGLLVRTGRGLGLYHKKSFLYLDGC